MRKGDLTIAFKVIGLSDALPTGHKMVAAAVLDHFNRGTGRCDPSLTTLAELLGISRRSVIRAMHGLETAGFFRKDRHGGNFHCNHYTPVWSRFREADAAWDVRRRRHRARFDRTDLSPSQCQTSHVSGDSDVTQTSPNNLSYRTSGSGSASKGNIHTERSQNNRSTTTMELIGKSPQRQARCFHVKQTRSRDAMREAAQRRWDNELSRRFSRHQGLYSSIIEAVSVAMLEAATDAELQRPGSGAAYIIQQAQIRGLKLPSPADSTSRDGASTT